MEAECWLTAYELEILRKQAKALYRITVMSEKGSILSSRQTEKDSHENCLRCFDIAAGDKPVFFC